MIAHAYVPHPVWKRDQCEFKYDDDGRVGFCGKPRSEHMDSEHALRVQLATALKERDEAREEADKQRARRNICQQDRNAYELQNDALRAEVQRLRDLCRDVQGWVDEKHATEHFDGLAEKFLKATGHLPPGKSRPMEMGVESEQEQEDNRVHWRAFNQKALADVCDRIRTALATGGPTT